MRSELHARRAPRTVNLCSPRPSVAPTEKKLKNFFRRKHLGKITVEAVFWGFFKGWGAFLMEVCGRGYVGRPRRRASRHPRSTHQEKKRRDFS